MSPTSDLAFTTRRRTVAGLIALIGMVGVFLIPTASYASPDTSTTLLTCQTSTVAPCPATAAAGDDGAVPVLQADAVPATAGQSADGGTANLTIPTISFPSFDFSTFFENLFQTIQHLLQQIFSSFCGLLGGSFCSS